MSSRFVFVSAGALALVACVSVALAAPEEGGAKPIAVPENMERWPTVGATVALSYEVESSTTFNTVRMDPESFDAYTATGAFPVGTMLQLEIRRQATDVEPARGGSYQGEIAAYSIHVKDETAGPGTWTFYNWRPGMTEANPIGRDQSCYSCHDEHAETDTVFTQFYPALEEVRARLSAGE